MQLRTALIAAAVAVATVAVPAHVAAQRGRARNRDDRGPEQTERVMRTLKLGRNGRVTIANIAGDIKVTSGSGDDVVIDAVKRTRGDARELASVQIAISNGPGRVDVRTEHPGRNDQVSVDFTVSVPLSASIDLRSVSGDVVVAGVEGPGRAESVSGNVRTSKSPHVESAKAVSGD